MRNLFGKYKYLFGLLSFYFLFRLINLTTISIFNDEAIYLDWGWRELHRGVLFYSLLDAKQPLLMWLFGLSEGIFNDQLFAGRVVSVVAGLLSLLGVYYIGKDFFSEKIARISALFYIIVPIFSFFDRQALMESSVAAGEIWAVYLFMKLRKKHSIKMAVLLGLVLGISFFVKFTILLLLISACVTFLVNMRFKNENKKFVWDMIIAFITSQIVLIPIYFQTQFWQTLPSNSRYTMGIRDLLGFPILAWLLNLWGFLQVSFWQLTPLVAIAMLVGIVLIMRSDRKEQKLIAWIFLIQVLVFILVAKDVNARYVMPMLPLSLLFIGVAVLHFVKWSKVFMLILIIAPIYFTCLQILQPFTYFDQLQSLTTYSQRADYTTNSTGGYAVTQAVNYLQSIGVYAAVIAVRLDTGNPENAIFTYFHNSSTELPTFLEARIIANEASYQCLYYRVPVYFVSRDYQLAGLKRFLQEEQRFYNPGNLSSVGIYVFKPSCKGNTLDLSTPGAILQPR